MASAPKALADQGFVRLNKVSYAYDPLAPTLAESVSNRDSPDLIILCSWLDADPRHISKYTSGFHTLFPNSRILLLTSNLWHMLPSDATRIARTAPIVSKLMELPESATILAVAYSNGGSIPMTDIAFAYKTATGKPLNVEAALLDSAPGKGDFMHMMKLPFVLPSNLVARLFIKGALYVYFIFGFAKLWVNGGTAPHEATWRRWNDRGAERIFGEEMRRVYVGSKSDVIVTWDETLEHCGEARKSGWECVVEEFEKSKGM